VFRGSACSGAQRVQGLSVFKGFAAPVVTSTKNGSPAAILIGVDEWEALQEALFWLSQDASRETLAQARALTSNVEGSEGRIPLTTLDIFAGPPVGFEPTTPALQERCSSQLS
jgi:hypothetical protein